MRRNRQLALILFAGSAIAVASHAATGAAPSQVPTPTVISAPDMGPIASSEAALVRAAGYAETEFFIDGMASSFTSAGAFGIDGRLAIQPADRAPYRVRMVVRAPTDASRFNGVVFVEWLNVSGQTEASPNFTLLSPELFRDGYAYVGVGVQSAGINANMGLKVMNPARYATLNHPGDSFSYDIFSQAAQAVRNPSGLAPLGALTGKVRLLIGDGESQSAGRMVTYVDAVHPTANVYDGFFIHSRSASGAALAQADPGSTRQTVALPPAVRIRTDLRVPVFQLQSETDVERFVPARQPDDKLVRTWEMAGTSHADRFLLTDGGQRPVGIDCPSDDPKTVVPINDGPQTFLLRAALRALRSWMEGGTPPPSGEAMVLQGNTLARDPATGLVLGGVRSPQVDVPVRTLSGVRGAASGGGFCFLFGRSDPWDGDKDPWDGGVADPSPTPEPVLSKLYPTRSAFLSQFEDALQRGIKGRFLLADDAEEIRAEAMQQSQGW
jgi:hypothetical protein